jgi:hypothetical protein
MIATATLEFAVEKYKVVWEEGDRGLFQKHWEDLAIDKVIPWDLNHELYTEMESKGMLHVVTARCDGRIVGYHVGILAPHLHYKSAGIMCYEDMYYLLPEFRIGGAGAKLFMFIEDSLREKGITKWFLSTKLHQDHSLLFKALGFRLQDLCYTKLLV